MDAKTTQPKQTRRNWRSRISVVFLLTVALCIPVLSVVWLARVAVVTRVVRTTLDQQGFTDATFRFSRLSLGRVVVEDIRLGAPEAVLSVGQVDVRFSLQEVLRRHVERVSVQGVRTRLTVAGDGKVTSPLFERLKPLLEAQAKKTPGGTPTKGRFSLGVVSVQDVQVGVALPDGQTLTTLTFAAGLASELAVREDAHPPKAVSHQGGRVSVEPACCYRVWGSVRDEGLFQAKVDGSADVSTGAVTLTPELKCKSVEGVVALARRAVPAQMSKLNGFPTNCSLAVRGSVALQNWTNAGPFELVAELGRGSQLRLPDKDASVKFQSLRVEAFGLPSDAQCRVSVGVSGFTFGGQLQASQAEGRMLGLRGTARFRQTGSNQWVTATLDSDFPSRSVSQVLPRILPLVPVFFSEGGTLHVEADVKRLPRALWNGLASFRAEAVRSSVPLTAGRVGAGMVSVTGTVAIVDARPGVVQTQVKIEEAYFFRRNLSVRGGADMTLTAVPPYTSATGGFKGRVSESVALPQSHLLVTDGAVPFEGEATATGLTSNPVWQVMLRVPEFGVSSSPDGAAGGNASGMSARSGGGRSVSGRPQASGAGGSALTWSAMAGATAAIRYSMTSMRVDGESWVRDVAMQVGSESNRTVEAGISRITAQVKVPPFTPANVSNAVVSVNLGVSNGWARVGALAVLEDVRTSVPLTWSLAKELSFLPEQSLSWQRLEAQGLKVEPDVFALSASGKTVEVRFGARVAASRLGVTVKATVPLEDLSQMVVDVALPEAEITADDALAGAIRDMAKGVEFSGRVAAEAQVLFWGTHPRIVGRLKLAEGQVRKDKMAVEGLAADVPFQKGISFRTIERPVVSFIRAHAGNVQLDQGRMTFQLTEKEFFVDRMDVGWCKGSLNAYSVHLMLKNPKDDFVVYADRIDLGEALMMVLPFKGKMQGVLYGRFPVGFDNGHVKLSKGFLYSLPGQGGMLKLDDNTQMASLLEKAGIKGEVQLPLARALSDMDFSTFKMDLEPGQGDEGTLRIKLGGKSNDKEWPAPVDVNLNLHGPLEELLNMGLNVSRK